MPESPVRTRALDSIQRSGDAVLRVKPWTPAGAELSGSARLVEGGPHFRKACCGFGIEPAVAAGRPKAALKGDERWRPRTRYHTITDCREVGVRLSAVDCTSRLRQARLGPE